MTDRIRTTISIPQDVYEVFKQMADISGTSVSRCMGDWLKETSDGAQLVTDRLAEVRRSSDSAMRLVSDAMKAEFSGARMVNMLTGASGKGGERATEPREQASSRLAPSSNTGLKSTGRGKSGSKS